jgi:hypothetical protein
LPVYGISMQRRNHRGIHRTHSSAPPTGCNSTNCGRRAWPVAAGSGGFSGRSSRRRRAGWRR